MEATTILQLHSLILGMELNEIPRFVKADPLADTAVDHVLVCEDCRRKIAQSIGGRWGEGSKKT